MQESNPTLMTKFVKTLGMEGEWQFHDILGTGTLRLHHFLLEHAAVVEGANLLWPTQMMIYLAWCRSLY